jgi:hypothetical protein
VRKSQTLAAVLALALAVLAAETWWSDVRFRERATRVAGTLVGFDSVHVRSLFTTEVEHHPIVSFVDGGGETRRFTVQSTATRVGVATDAPIGSELGALVLYDPADPTRAQLEAERRGRGALILVIAAVGLLVTPRVLGYAFKDLRPTG